MSSISEFIEVKEVNPENQVREMLNQLIAVQEQIVAKASYYDAAIAALQTARTEAIGSELPTLESKLTKSIKSVAVSIGYTIKGTEFTEEGIGKQAVWSKGRTSWDTTALVSLIPEIQDEELKQKFSDCQKTGEPSISIRVVKKAEKVEEAGNLF